MLRRGSNGREDSDSFLKLHFQLIISYRQTGCECEGRESEDL